ncbi:MAG: thiamine phosphate synthase [Chromatiales bacterium]|jgi:thiamine-phosphate pyrophosphorylase
MSHQLFNGLYLLTSHDQHSTRRLLEDIEQALQAGARLIQYRDKSAEAEKRRQQAQALKQLCRTYDARLIINDDVELAHAIQADGVHLGRDDAALQQARTLLGAAAIIGLSCYNRLGLAVSAQQQGADYVAFGRFFSSSSKPEAVQANVALLQTARAQLQLPIVAIGGITPDNAASLIEAGADMVAVIHGVFGQPDIGHATRQFVSLFNQ